MKKKKKDNIFSSRELFFVWTIGALLFLLISQVIIFSVEDKQNQKIKEICNDVMIKYRSCSELAFAKSFCSDAEKQYDENNCTEIYDGGWLWQEE